MPLSLPPERPAAVLGLDQLFPCVLGDGRSVPWHVSLSHQHPQDLSPPFAAPPPAKGGGQKGVGAPPWEILGIFPSLPRCWQRGKVVIARVSPRIGGAAGCSTVGTHGPLDGAREVAGGTPGLTQGWSSLATTATGAHRTFPVV